MNHRSLLMVAAVTAAQLPGGLHAAEIDPQFAQRIVRLEQGVDRAEAVRQVKLLQTAYAHFAEFGLWNEAADLFADKGVLQIGDQKIAGRKAILAYFMANYGNGRIGLAPGDVTSRMQLTPVVNLAADGRAAKGRWHELAMAGRVGGSAGWSGGISENDYVLEQGRWKIARLHLYPMFAGSYEDGWKALEDDIKVVPAHFVPDTAGVPIPAPSADALSPASPATQEEGEARLGAVAERLAQMAAHDAAIRLQNAYGYYVDQKMWNDVTDLFARDGTFEIAGVGLWKGEQGIRRSFGSMASNGLQKGEVNEHLQLEPIVAVAPGGREAWVRVFQLGMLGKNNVGGWWTHGIVESHVVQGEDGVWRIAAITVYPKLRTDYYQGWHKSRLPEPSPAKGYEPDAASTFALSATQAWVPAFRIANPATGKDIAYPAGMTVLPLAAAPSRPSPGQAAVADIAALERALAVEKAYDAVENVSHAFGAYLDDFDWKDSAQLFARTGRRGKYQVGFYVGPERIYTAEHSMYGDTPSPRKSVQIHLRLQPVIDVAPDGLSAKLRTRLFSLNASTSVPGSFMGAVYPNDRLIQQEGVWKFQHQSIDEMYVRSAGYKNGWAKVPEADQAKQFAADRPPSIMDKLRTSFPPDANILDMGLRAVGFAPNQEFVDFPDIKPMWFHYVNPVSGRVPPNYCPDHSTCYQPAPLFTDQQPTPAP